MADALLHIDQDHIGAPQITQRDEVVEAGRPPDHVVLRSRLQKCGKRVPKQTPIAAHSDTDGPLAQFTFHALETTTDWAEKTYAARGFPTNLLVDAEGRIMFKPGIIRSPREQRTFELQIEALLAHVKKGS